MEIAAMTATVLFLMFYLSIASCSGAFDEAPISQEVATGAEAVFRCRHLTADFIRWRVNSSLIRRSSPPADITPSIIRDDNGNLVDTLTITARPEYNGTEVVCVAWFDDDRPDELSQPVTLIVLVNASVVDDIFLISPASLNVTVDTVAVFQCQHPIAHGINWKINGSILQDLPEGFSTDRSDDRVFSLNIEALANYSHTVIQCVALFTDSPSEESQQSIMMIQGTLQLVTNFSRNANTISWSPPFSLDLTDIEPDIIYCVEVYNITCGERDLIISDCSVTEPSYTSDDLLDGYIYEYIITPRSNVEGARNGTPYKLREQFNKYLVNSPRLTAEDSSTMYMYEAKLNAMTSDGQMPSACMLLLESLDGLGNSKETVACNRSSNPINLEVNPERLWRCSILANGCWNDSVLDDYPELSTHAVQNISVSSPRDGSITVTGDFLQGSTATGVLIITININDTNDVQYHLCHRNRNSVQVGDTISGLAGGDHRVSAFVLEQSGYPFNRAATTPKFVKVMNDSESVPHSTILYDLQSNSTHICVTCIFNSSPPTGCLVVVHQRISQLSSSGLMSIESSDKFTRIGDTADGCIETNLKEYQIGVVEVVDVPQQGSSSVCSGCIVGSVLAVVMFVVFNLVLVTFVLMYWKILKNRRKRDILQVSVYMFERDGENQYEHIPSSLPKKVVVSTGENVPLVSSQRVESEGYTEGINQQLNSQTPPTFSPPPIPQAAVELNEETVEATKTMYSELDCHPNPGCSAPPPQGDEPKYSSVYNFKNSQGVVYACHVVKPQSNVTRSLMTEDSTKTISEYSELIHQAKSATTPTATYSNKLESPTSPFVSSSPDPCTLENLLPLLHSIASEWLSLGKALSIDEDDLDIIDTNNETDEACLQDMLEFHEGKSFQHTWEVVAKALKRIHQDGLAEKIYGLYINPYANPLPGQTEIICTKGSPTCNITTEDDESEKAPEIALYERSDSTSSSGYSSGKSPRTDSTDLSNSSDNEDEGYADAGIDGHRTHTQKEVQPVQPTAQDVPKQDGIVHVHNSGPQFQPKDLKKPVTFQHLDDDNPEQRKVHGQCEDDVETPTSTDDSYPNKKVMVKNLDTVVACTGKKHHHITDDESRDPSERKVFSMIAVPIHHTSQSVFKKFVCEQDNYYKVSQGSEDCAGDDKESSCNCLHHTATSTIPLTDYKYTFTPHQLANKGNIDKCLDLWQIRAQALSQEGTEICQNDDIRQEPCLNPETVLNKRLRVDKRNKLRINFHRFQEVAR